MRFRKSLPLCGALIVNLGFALRTYDSTAPLDSDKIVFSWTLTADSANFALQISDPSTVRANASSLWLGIGIGDPQSGGMLGADIATAIFDQTSSSASCTLADRHVKSVAYPLGSSNGGDAVYPEEDTCGGSDWKISDCKINLKDGSMSLELDRALKAGNRQEDRDIDKNSNIILAAWGDGFGYHDSNRLSIEIDMTKSGKEAVGAISLEESGRIPQDATGSQVLAVERYAIPSNRTTYACSSFLMDVAAGGKSRQVIAVEPMIDTTTPAGRMVHHFVLQSCSRNDAFEASLGTTIECFSVELICRDIIFGWGKGSGPLIFPEVAGFPVSDEKRFFVLQIHYDNPDMKGGVIDSSSGVKLHTTDKRRKYDAGTINVGDPFVSMAKNVQSNVNYTISCPAECTSQLAGPVTIYDSFLHSHTTGKQMWTNLFRDGEPARTIESSAYWSDGHQRHTLFEETELRPGDRLVVGANFDNAKRKARGDGPMKWGIGTNNEMLMTFLFVYPRPVKASGNGSINYCGYAGPDVTMCTDGVSDEDGVDYLPVSTLSIGGQAAEEGFSVEFGGAVQCQASIKSEGKKKGKSGKKCFPARARVQLPGGVTKAMDELTIGDMVLVDKGVYSPVFMFTHKLPPFSGQSHEFLEITMSSGSRLEATPGHFIPLVGGALVPVGLLSVGDQLSLGSGETSDIIAVRPISGAGLYNPQTVHGNIVVNGVVCSTYTTAVAPSIAHVALAPLRGLFHLAGLYLKGALLDH